MADSDTQYHATFLSLQPGTVYYVFTTGKESTGTLVATSIEQSMYSFKTEGETPKPLCPTSTILSADGNIVEATCSHHGVCEGTTCMYIL